MSPRETPRWQLWGPSGGGGQAVKELGRNQPPLRTSGLDASDSHWALLTFHLNKRRSTICAALMWDAETILCHWLLWKEYMELVRGGTASQVLHKPQPQMAAPNQQEVEGLEPARPPVLASWGKGWRRETGKIGTHTTEVCGWYHSPLLRGCWIPSIKWTLCRKSSLINHQSYMPNFLHKDFYLSTFSSRKLASQLWNKVYIVNSCDWIVWIY